jgi:DNA-binding PadR family transcriptional regulator
LTIAKHTIKLDTIMNDLILLATLLRGPTYGYALKRAAGLIFGNQAMHPNIVYPLLKRFVQNDWVEQSTEPGERGQIRKQYKITAAGRRYLIDRLGTFSESEAADEYAFLFRVALFDVLPVEKRTAIAAARKAFLESRALQLRRLKAAMQPVSYGAVAFDRNRAIVASELRWIRQLELALATRKGDLQYTQACANLYTGQPS